MCCLFPSRAPFIPTKRTSSPLNSLVLPREIAHLPPENEIFFAPCNSLAYGEMNTTQRAVLGNILREDLVCI